MTVSELKEHLDQFPEDMQVFISRVSHGESSSDEVEMDPDDVFPFTTDDGEKVILFYS